MAGGRKHIDIIGSAVDCRSSADVVLVLVEGLNHHLIRILIVIAVLRRLVADVVVNLRVALEVIAHGLHELREAKALLIKDVVLDGYQCVRDIADTDALHVARAVSRTACVVVLALRDAVVRAD